MQPRPISQNPELHATPSQAAFGPQVTSHAHDGPHVTVWHDWVPVQSVLQRPVPHVSPVHELLPVHANVHAPMPQLTLRHAREPEQVSSHDAAVWQLTPLRHASGVLHLMSQFQPAGQVTGPLQPPLSAQSIVHCILSRAHEVHCAGHAAGPSTEPSLTGGAASIDPAGTMHSPSLHTRGESQSEVLAHSNAPLR